MENNVNTFRAWQGQFLGRGVALLPVSAAAAATGVSIAIARRDVVAAGQAFTQNTHKYMVPGPPRGRSC